MEYTRAFLAYDTLCRIAAEIPENGEQLLEQCEEEAHELERTLSMFDPDSELSRLCRDIRPGESVPVSETLYTFLEQNLEICRLSGGVRPTGRTCFAASRRRGGSAPRGGPLFSRKKRGEKCA